MAMFHPKHCLVDQKPSDRKLCRSVATKFCPWDLLHCVHVLALFGMGFASVLANKISSPQQFGTPNTRMPKLALLSVCFRGIIIVTKLLALLWYCNELGLYFRCKRTLNLQIKNTCQTKNTCIEEENSYGRGSFKTNETHSMLQTK